MKKFILLLSVCMTLLLTGCQLFQNQVSKIATDAQAAEQEVYIPTRSPNSSNSVVGEFELSGGDLYYSGEQIPTTEIIRDGVNTLTIMDHHAFFFNQHGYGMWNFETKTWKPLYYDVMFDAVAGINNIYYLVEVDYYPEELGRYENLNPQYSAYMMYSLSKYREAIIYETRVLPSCWVVIGNSVFYATSTEIKRLNLVTDELVVLKEHEGKLTKFEARSGKLIVIDGTQTSQFEAE